MANLYVLVGFLTFLIAFLYRFWPPQRLTPGPPAYPFIGHAFLGGGQRHRLLIEWSKKYNSEVGTIHLVNAFKFQTDY